jgi:hypothetical protein
MNWRQNPQRVAWIILIVNFTLCCVLTVAVPLGLRTFLLHSTRQRAIFVRALTGTVQVRVPNVEEPRAVTENRSVPPASQIATDKTSRALITVYADEGNQQVLATIQALQDTALTVAAAQTPRFAWSGDPHRIVLRLTRGQATIVAQAIGGRPVQVEVTTPEARALLAAGTFDVLSRDGDTEVRARSGATAVTAAGVQVTARDGELVTVAAGRAPALPVPGAQNLLRGGGFEGPLAPAWTQFADVTAGFPPGQALLETDGARRAVRLVRRQGDNVHNLVGIRQTLNRDVQRFDVLTLRLDVRLVYQSVPGGGYLASEYPLMVEIAYTDIYGKDLVWRQGFYYQELPPGSTYRPPEYERIPAGVWHPYESPNLLELLRETRPARINAISLRAEGHDYDSLVSDVVLSAR